MNVVIGDRPYELVPDSIEELSSRPSQPADAGAMQMAEFNVSGPAFNSIEDISQGQGYLGVCGPIDVDTRWPNEASLGPLLNTISLSGHDHQHVTPLLGATPLNTTFILGATPKINPSDGMAIMKANGKRYGYITRGQVPAKVEFNTWLLRNANLELSGPAKSIVLTRAEEASADQEITIGLGEGQDYRTLNFGNVGLGYSGDAWGGNDEGRGADIVARAPDRAVALEDDTIYGNILTGTGGSATTMAAPSWGTVATITGYDFEFTGFITDGNLWIIMTSLGPFLLDADLADFFPLFPNSDEDSENGRAAYYWPQLGTIFGMRDGAYQMSGTQGYSWGVETFEFNTCQIQGYPTAHAGSPHRLWQAVRNDNNGHSYLIEWRKRKYNDPHPDHQFVPYPIAKFTSEQCRFLSYVGRLDGVFQHPTLIGGKGTDAFYISLGETARDIDDPHYTYAASGTLALTEMRRNPGVLKDIEAFEFTTDNCTTTETITPDITIDDMDETVSTFIPIKEDGFQRIVLKDLTGKPNFSGYRIKPSLSFARGDTTTLSPKVIGPLRMFYRERPLTVRVFQLGLYIRGNEARTAEEQAEDLMELKKKSAQYLEGLPIEWGRIEDVQIADQRDRGGDPSRAEQKVATVRIAGWS